MEAKDKEKALEEKDKVMAGVGEGGYGEDDDEVVDMIESSFQVLVPFPSGASNLVCHFHLFAQGSARAARAHEAVGAGVALPFQTTGIPTTYPSVRGAPLPGLAGGGAPHGGACPATLTLACGGGVGEGVGTGKGPAARGIGSPAAAAAPGDVGGCGASSVQGGHPLSSVTLAACVLALWPGGGRAGAAEGRGCRFVVEGESQSVRGLCLGSITGCGTHLPGGLCCHHMNRFLWIASVTLRPPPRTSQTFPRRRLAHGLFCRLHVWSPDEMFLPAPRPVACRVFGGEWLCMSCVCVLGGHTHTHTHAHTPAMSCPTPEAQKAQQLHTGDLHRISGCTSVAAKDIQKNCWRRKFSGDASLGVTAPTFCAS